MTGMLKPSTKNQGLPEVHPGDIVRVHQKIKEGGKERVQVFEGIVIKTHGKTGSNASFTVRKITYGVGVERTYPLQSPNIVKIEFKKGSEVHRAKLYYLRKLSGKSLKMKEKKIDQDIWELVAKVDEPEELSKEVLEEAVQAAKEKEEQEIEPTETVADTTEVSNEPVDTPPAVSEKGDTVEGEESVGEKQDSQS
jgi:large subunit ribosomal protein L19